MSEKIPRASISVRFFGDEDTLVLMSQGEVGERAVLMFIQLLTLAKELRNNGVFQHGIAVYAARLNMTTARASACFSLLCASNGRKDAWIVVEDGGFRIRSWTKYNDPVGGWGGVREGSGRKSRNQDGNHLDSNLNNQDGIKTNHLGAPSVTVNVNSSDTSSSLAVFSQNPNRTTTPKTARQQSEEPEQNTPNDPLLAHVESCVAKSMRRNPPELLLQRNEPQKVQAALAEWRSKYPPTINVHNGGCDLDEMIRRAATHAEGAELGGQVGGVLAWIDSTIDGCIRGEVWPGEFRKAAKPKPASRSHLNNGRTW